MKMINIKKDSLYPDVLSDDFIAIIQRICYDQGFFLWSRMMNFFVAEPAMIVIERFKPYIWISYDYSFDGIKYYSTTHFKEFISMN